MDRRFAIEARYATCRKDASGHQLWIMEIDGHLRTIDQTGCGASSAPIPERNVVIVIDLYAAPGADLREAVGKAGSHQTDMARKCGIDMLLNKLWYRHLCSLSCPSKFGRASCRERVCPCRSRWSPNHYNNTTPPHRRSLTYATHVIFTKTQKP